jgi:hypothetical protein
MFQKTIKEGSRQVIISANTIEGPFTSNLYVNHGEDITLIRRKAQTLKGAEKQAAKMLEDAR